MKPTTRALRLFGDIRDDEAGRVLRLMLSMFALMLSYYVLKTLREPLILASGGKQDNSFGGAELKSLATGVQAVVLMFAVAAYSWLASRVERAKLIRRTLGFFLACLPLFAAASWLGLPKVGFVFYVWVGIFGVASVAQFWSFANDLYSRSAGERLFAVIAVGQAAGAAVGSKLAERMFDGGVGVVGLLTVAAGLLLAHLSLYPLARAPERDAQGTALADTRGGLRLVLSNPYLRLLGGVLILLNLVNTTGEYILSRFAVEAAHEQLEAALAAGPVLDSEAFLRARIGAFYGAFFFDVNLIVVLLQALVVSRLVKLVGFRGVVFTLPLVALGTYVCVALGAGITLFRALKVAENSSDYSVMNTARAMAWLPTSRAEKYKAKQALDTCFVRLGDVLSAGVVIVGTQSLQLERSGFAWFNLSAVTVWLVLSLAIARRYARAEPERESASAEDVPALG